MPAANRSPFDPLDRLDPGEDRFGIRQKDPAGPGAITEWARLRRNWAIRTYGTDPVGDAKRLLDAELTQCAEAEEKALAWKEAQAGGESVDGVKATYSEAVASEEQIAAAKRQKCHTALVAALREADYLAHELIEIDGPAATADLGEQAMALHELADAVQYGARVLA